MPHPLARCNLKIKSGLKFQYAGTDYKLAGKLGDGAVGIVRRAVTTSGKEVAIKFLAPDPKYIDPEFFDDVAGRFIAEGKRGSRLEHTGLVDIYGYSANENGQDFASGNQINPYLMMERVKGKTLESYIRESDAEFDFNRERLYIALQITDAIIYIHQKKMVHRDLKPANIFLSGYTKKNGLPKIKIGDFGIVKWGDFHRHLATGAMTVTHQKGLGTMKYMSPEQATDPKRISIKSDIFSIGITLYELLTGEILGSAHHVFQLMSTRMTRGSTHARFMSLGHDLVGEEDAFCEKLLDCFLRGIANRPKIADLHGCLSHLYSLLFDTDWRTEQ